MAQIEAIANCRVSSVEQLLNNSLTQQDMSIKAAAEKLNVKIVKVWSGSVSSKAGTNVNRKDLLEMLEYCKTHKNVKYAIFDVYDRYMRSVNEGPYFEVLFHTQGVKVWYAAESDTFNGDDAMAKFMRAISAFNAEGSNEERQRKSITGHSAALKQGRYTFPVKPGYKRGYQSGIHEIHEVHGPILREILTEIAARRIEPSKALIKYNQSAIRKNRYPYKMDKFREIITDPYYAGIVVMEKQIKVRNENGLHEPLISKDQHRAILEIMANKKKSQAGPQKNGNPEFPLNNIVTCEKCLDKKNGRIVGFKHTNGKKSSKTYYKYRCRSCGRYIQRDLLHSKVTTCIESYMMHPIMVDFVLKTLNEMWEKEAGQAAQEINRLNHKISVLKQKINQQVESVSDPEYALVKDEILVSISQKKDEIQELEKEIYILGHTEEKDRDRFIGFTFTTLDNMDKFFLVMEPERRARCKQVLFPDGFVWQKNNEVYTPKVSPIYTLFPYKKNLSKIERSLMVRVRGL